MDNLTGSISSVGQPEGHLTPAGKVRWTNLDGLRGWGALLVVIFHATWVLFKYYLPAFQDAPPTLFGIGKLSVYCFFVLSAFVLSYPFFVTKHVGLLRRASLRRYPRLTIPVLAASFLAFVIMKAGLLFNAEANAIVQTKNWLGTFYQQTPTIVSWLKFSLYDVYFRYDLVTSYDVYLWTMPWELAGSFLVFALLALSGSSKRTRYLWYLGLLLICAHEQSILLNFVFGMAMADFAASSAYRDIENRKWANYAGLAMLVLALSIPVLLNGIYSVRLSALLAAFVVASAILWRPMRSAMQGPFSQFLARISFPIYLIHSLVICSLSSWLILEFTRRGMTREMIVAIVAPVTIIVSIGAAVLFAPVEVFSINASRVLARMVTGSKTIHSRSSDVR
ncbi:acyltransferase [soil metagenome]